MSHVDEGTLHAYLDGELPAPERERWAVHIAACAECRTRLEEERALAARARELLAHVAPPARAPVAPRARRPARAWRSVRLPLAWAATVTIAFAVGWYLQGARVIRAPVPGTGESGGVAPAPVALTPPPSPPPPAATAHPRPPERAAVPVGALHLQAEPSERQAPAAGGALTDGDSGMDEARRLLGQPPAVLAGLAIRRVSVAEDGDVVVEQQLESGTVIRLYERPASGATPSPAADAVAAPSRAAASRRAPAVEAAEARAPRAGERLARYVGSLRVEIAGPLPADSLTKLLDLVNR